MKSILTAFLIAVGTSYAIAQETLQSVTDNGNTTTQNLRIGNVLSLQYGGSTQSSFAFDPAIQQMYLFGHSPSSFFSVYTAGTRRFDITANGLVGIGIANPISRLTVSGQENSNPSLYIQNTSYSGTDAVGTVSLRFAFLNHLGPQIEAYKKTRNETGLKFYTEYGYSTPQLGMVIEPSLNGPLVGIGTTTPQEKLSVNGKIRAHEVKVETTNWPDYVFEDGYKVETLQELESYIKTNKHLPEVPSAKEVAANGVELGEMNKILLKKIEELTLHLIEKEKKMEIQQALIDKQQIQLEKLEQNHQELKNIVSKFIK